MLSRRPQATFSRYQVWGGASDSRCWSAMRFLGLRINAVGFSSRKPPGLVQSTPYRARFSIQPLAHTSRLDHAIPAMQIPRQDPHLHCTFIRENSTCWPEHSDIPTNTQHDPHARKPTHRDLELRFPWGNRAAIGLSSLERLRWGRISALPCVIAVA
jgi:hypothetical protein